MTQAGEVTPHPPPGISGTMAGLEQKLEGGPLEPEFVTQLMFQIAYKRRYEAFGVVYESNDRRRFNSDLGGVEQFKFTSPPIVRRAP
jgi:hypothetical protein